MTDQQIEDPEVLRTRADRGAAALTGLPGPDRDRIDELLGEVPPALGVNFLSPLFSALANWPDWLEPTWRATAPLIDGPAWRDAVARLEAAANSTNDPPADQVGPPSAELTAYLALQARLLPQLMLLATAWYASDGPATGPTDAGTGHAPERAIDPTGPPAGEVSPDVESALTELATAHGHPRVLSVYRAIAAGGDLFRSESAALIERAGTPRHQDQRDRLRSVALAGAAGLGLPRRPVPEGALEILALFGSRLIPDLILDLGRLRARAGLGR